MLSAAIAGTAWLHAFGPVVAAIVAVASVLVSIVVWAVRRPPVQWRRLPWFAIAYALWATASLLVPAIVAHAVCVGSGQIGGTFPR